MSRLDPNSLYTISPSTAQDRNSSLLSILPNQNNQAVLLPGPSTDSRPGREQLGRFELIDGSNNVYSIQNSNLGFDIVLSLDDNAQGVEMADRKGDEEEQQRWEVGLTGMDDRGPQSPPCPTSPTGHRLRPP
ncbi:hypothetical protein B0T14DRAFT_498686 [Immersiella caudata]|uniref:Uncharacterized protein n=1 Tax=Immersiella caudata TaxID=314043 RepID=A0AA40BXZ7_9PEZI|nr:hypothetical protein B0T14DRAFT_498686 [Immersiella caudata]